MDVSCLILLLDLLALPLLGLAGFVLALGNRRRLDDRIPSLEGELVELRGRLRMLERRGERPPEPDRGPDPGPAKGEPRIEGSVRVRARTSGRVAATPGGRTSSSWT